MEQQAEKTEGGGVVRGAMSVAMGIVLAVVVVCGGSFASCVGLTAVGRVAQVQRQIALAEEVELQNVRLEVETFGRASSLRKIAYAVDFANLGDAPVEISGWLKVLDANGIELGRDHVSASIAAGSKWTVEGYVMDSTSGTPTSVKFVAW